MPVVVPQTFDYRLGSGGFSDFPAYGQILLRLALINLRTVIVTAAVYWGLDSELRVQAR